MSQDMSRFPEKWPSWEQTREYEEPNFDDDYDDEEEMVWEAETRENER